jgi:hypothetical protein
MENLTVCKRCEGNACLQQDYENNVTGWICFGCGFTTSTEMKDKSELMESLFETLPELYKDLAYVDDNSHVWVPCTVSLPDKGIVFLDGTSPDTWNWSGVLSVPLKEEEKYRFPEGQNTKVDYNNKKTFDKKDFMDALEYIGFFEQGIE